MTYNFVDGPVKPKKALVITPTIGSAKVISAIASVKNQTYANVEHLVVVDGPEHEHRFVQNFNYDYDYLDTITRITLPYNTGHGSQGFYGHRIYAAFAHLVDHDYIFFLDDDNWYEPDHVETLVKVLEQNDFAYSLRKIFDADQNYVCDDDCESLGKWPIFFTHDDPQYLIDTSAFAFRREFLIKASQFWHHGWGGDRHFLYAVKDHCVWDTNGKHTLCYRLDGNDNSVKADFFEQGNEIQFKHYKGKLPWLKTS
jgi:glycosyltransferase involved in cell wall biosynthesis